MPVVREKVQAKTLQLKYNLINSWKKFLWKLHLIKLDGGV
tara:strand:- start:839 stop:958 length:120 start_codon:yes stop_codon:yes gene_type:complete